MDARLGRQCGRYATNPLRRLVRASRYRPGRGDAHQPEQHRDGWRCGDGRAAVDQSSGARAPANRGCVGTWECEAGGRESSVHGWRRLADILTAEPLSHAVRSEPDQGRWPARRGGRVRHAARFARAHHVRIRLGNRPYESRAPAHARLGADGRFLPRWRSRAVQPLRHLHTRAAGRGPIQSHRVEQRVTARRPRLAGPARPWPGHARGVFPSLCAAGWPLSRLRQPQQSRRECVSMERSEWRRLV